MNRQIMKKWLSLMLCIAVLLSCASGLCLPAAAQQAESSFQVHFIDVGQADAALILCDGEAMLIDGGNGADSQIMYNYMEKMNVRHLNYVIGTHPHEDHIGGIPGALQFVDSIGTVYCSATSYTGSAFPKFISAVQKHGKSIQVPQVGTTFSLGSASCKIIAVNTSSSDVNDTSIVMRITYGENTFMFTGDAETPVEKALLNGNEVLKSDVLKVGHHGSASSTSYLWLREVAPTYAVICVGKDNDYGHPTETVLSRLRDADVKTYRTDMQGDIVCISDGKNITFSVARNPNADTFGGIGNNSTVAPTDPKQIVDEAYGLVYNGTLPYTATLTGRVTKINTPFNPENNNTISVTMAVPGRENYPILCYKMSGPGVDEIRVGSTVTVVGTIKKYNNTVEFYFPSLIECKTESGSDTPNTAVSSVAANAVQTGKPYKLATDCNGTKYYFTGYTDGVSYFLASSTDPNEAVTVYLEGTADQYKLYFQMGGVKTYIRLYERESGAANKGKPSLELTTAAPGESCRFDTTLKSLVYTQGVNSYYMGSYNSYTNFRSSNTYYVTGSNAAKLDVSQFPARFYEVEEAKPTVTTQPGSKIVKNGGTAKFTVKATGAGLKYQWQYRTSSSGTWANAKADGNTTATLSVPGTVSRHGYQYRCRITDSNGNAVNTKTVNLYVLGIKTQPATKAAVAGKTVQFTVKATGHKVTYQWQYRTSSADSWKDALASGNDTATLSVPATVSRHGYQYRCAVTDSKGNTVHTKTVNLYVLGVKTQPTNKTAKVGAAVKFTVKATGKELTYQWQYKTAGSGTWKNSTATGAKTATLTTTAKASFNGNQYRCKITDAYGHVVYTKIVKLTVTPS